MNEKKRQGFLFPIRDNKVGNCLSNIFIEVSIDEGRKYREILSGINNTLYQIFGKKNYTIEIVPVFELDKNNFVVLHIFFIELLLNSEGKFNQSLFERLILEIKEGKKDYLPDLTVGAVARRKDFFNLTEFITHLWKSLETRHIILTAPRRFGKTSVLYYLIDYPQNDFVPLHIDLERISSISSFIAEVIMSYNRWIKKEFENRSEQEINEIKRGLELSVKDNWKEKWQEFCQKLDEKLVFLFDEFSSMLENITRSDKTEAQKLLALLHQSLPHLRRTRCIITGSTLIRRIINNIGYEDKEGFYSIFNEERLPILSFEDGYELTQILLTRIGIKPTKEIVETILELIGAPIPFFIQLFVFEIEKEFSREGKIPIIEEIKTTYKENLLGPSCKSYFKHYYDHLPNYRLIYPSLDGIKDIFEELTRGERTTIELKPIFKHKCPGTTDEDFETLLNYLEDEFYIKKIKGRYTFTSNLLRDWWLRHSRYL